MRLEMPGGGGKGVRERCAHHRRDVEPMPVGREVRIRVQDGHTRVVALPNRARMADVLGKKHSAPLRAMREQGATTA